MLLAYIDVFLERLCAFCHIVASDNVSTTPPDQGGGCTLWRMCSPNYTNFQHAYPIVWSAHKVWICPVEARGKLMMDGFADQQPACHARGEEASDWIALRYACTNLS